MISDVELKKLQKLAKLDFSDGETLVFVERLQAVVSMIERLHEVQCEDIEPLRSVCTDGQRMRKDEVITTDISASLFQNLSGVGAEFAKEVKCFIVPKVIE